jgi:N4-gp56 family major capsid protein
MRDYPSQQTVMPAEVGATGKIRWQVTSEGYVSSSYYSNPVLAKNAFGVVDIEGGNAKNIVKSFGSGGTSDPLNQRATSGWKCWDVTRILNDNFMHIARCTNG